MHPIDLTRASSSWRIDGLLLDEACRRFARCHFERCSFATWQAFGALRGSDGVLGGHHGWAECSLVMAENILTSAFGLAPPGWINATTYDKYIRFHNSPAERQLRGGWRQG